MTQDPIQPLADIGRRVLKTARYLTTPPVPNQPPWSYETRSRDPVVALSDTCGDLLKGLAVAPVAAEPEGFANEPVSPLAPAPNPGSAFPSLLRHGEARSTADRRDEIVYSRTGDRPAERSDTTGPGPDGTSHLEQSRHSIFEPDSSENGLDSNDRLETAESRERGGQGPRTQSQTASLRPATARRTPGSRDMRHPVDWQPTERPPGAEPPEWPEGEPSPEEVSNEAWSSVGQGRPETRQTESPADARAENGRARRAGASDVPPHGSRLTASTERLAAMLRSQVAQPEVAQEENQEDRDVFQSRRGDTDRGTSLITVQSGTTCPDFEEIMERLADELETEFVRTYGSSGG